MGDCNQSVWTYENGHLVLDATGKIQRKSQFCSQKEKKIGEIQLKKKNCQYEKYNSIKKQKQI